MSAFKDSLGRFERRRAGVGAALLLTAALSTACASQRFPLESANSTVELMRPGFSSSVVQTPLEPSESRVGTPSRREEDEPAASTPEKPSAPAKPSTQEAKPQPAPSSAHGGTTTAIPKPRKEHPSSGTSALTIAGYSVQIVGVGGLVTGYVLGTERNGTQTASSAFAIGGAVALLAGTIMTASGPALTYGPALPAFIEQR